MAGTSTDNSRTSSSTTEVNVGTVNVQTQATDAKGIAGDMKQSLNYQFAAQANTGMS